MSKLDAQVIIIGAGIAGLTAAWELKQSGIQALVLEASKTVGGRMQSVQIDDALIDYGAQFLSSAYSIIPKLIKDVELSDEFIETHEWVGLVRNEGVALIHPQKPWCLVSNNIISTWNLLRLMLSQLIFFNFKRKLFSLNDISAWVQYDNQAANKWVSKNFGETISRELTASIFNGFYFQSLNNSSAAMAAAVLAFSAYSPKTMTLKSGMGSLPQKLADKLNVKTNVSVSTVIETSFGINVISDAGEFNAEHVIVTVPAPIAKNLIPYPDKQTLQLFETPYSSTVTISLLANKNWLPPSNISSVYGFLFNPNLDSQIAALTIENNKCHTRKKQGFLVNIMLADKCAKKLLHLSDEEIYTKIQADVEKILPAICSNLNMKKIFRWQYAMPCAPIGRAKAVKEYHDTRNENNRIWLAGDYLGLPWTDSAAQTGLWAARQVCKRLLGMVK